MSYDKSFLTAHCRARKISERSEISGIESGPGSQQATLRHVRRVHSIEKKHGIDALEVTGIPKYLPDSPVTRGKSDKRQMTDTLGSSKCCGYLARHAIHQRIESRWIRECTMLRSRTCTEIHNCNSSVVLQVRDGLLGQPCSTKEMNDQIDTFILSRALGNPELDRFTANAGECSSDSTEIFPGQPLMCPRLVSHR